MVAWVNRFMARRRTPSRRSAERNSAAGSRAARPATWQNAACGLLVAPKYTGSPTMPSRPMVATSTTPALRRQRPAKTPLTAGNTHPGWPVPGRRPDVVTRCPRPANRAERAILPAGQLRQDGVAPHVVTGTHLRLLRLGLPRSGWTMSGTRHNNYPDVVSATRHSSAVADFGFVVIVASLGGIDAVSTVVSGLPADYPVPVLIALHRGLTRTGTDPLPAILAQRTQLAVRPAHHMMDLHRPGIVVIPRGATAVVDSAARLYLTASPVDIHHFGDQVLSSAARVAPTIAVVLTGMLSDGADGCREVNHRGGRVLVEDPATCSASLYRPGPASTSDPVAESFPRSTRRDAICCSAQPSTGGNRPSPRRSHRISPRFPRCWQQARLPRALHCAPVSPLVAVLPMDNG